MRLLDLCRNLAAANSSALSDLIRHVIGIRAEKQMIRVAANWIVAFMQALQVVRNRAIVQFIRESMRAGDFPVDPQATVTTIEVALPFPALIWATHIDSAPESFLRACMSKARTMTPDKTYRLSFDMPVSLIVVAGKWCGLTATTQAKTARVGAMLGRMLRVMVADKSNRLARDRATSLVCPLSERGKRTTSTFAQSLSNFLSVHGCILPRFTPVEACKWLTV